MAPSFVVVAAVWTSPTPRVEPSGFEPGAANPMVALVWFTASRDVMGEFANTRLTNALAIAATGFVCLLNGSCCSQSPAWRSRQFDADNGFGAERKFKNWCAERPRRRDDFGENRQ